MHLIKGFLKISNCKKLLLIKSIVLTLLIRICLYILPFSKIYPISIKLSKIHVNRKNPKKVRDIIWSIKISASYIPRASCLVQAISAQILMKHYNHDSILKIGVSKSDSFEAHAWLEMDKKIILGESEKNFVPIINLEIK